MQSEQAGNKQVALCAGQNSGAAYNHWALGSHTVVPGCRDPAAAFCYARRCHWPLTHSLLHVPFAAAHVALARHTAVTGPPPGNVQLATHAWPAHVPLQAAGQLPSCGAGLGMLRHAGYSPLPVVIKLTQLPCCASTGLTAAPLTRSPLMRMCPVAFTTGAVRARQLAGCKLALEGAAPAVRVPFTTPKPCCHRAREAEFSHAHPGKKTPITGYELFNVISTLTQNVA